MQAQSKAKNVSIEKLKEHIANIIGKNVVESVQNVHNSNVVTSKVYKLDLQPLSLMVKHNWNAHVDYLKHTQENADILREIVEHARELRPLDSDLDSAFAGTPINKTRRVRFVEANDTSKDKTQKQVQPQEKQTTNNSMSPFTRVRSSTKASESNPRSNTKKDRITQTSSSNKKTNKVEDQPRIAKSSLNNLNRVSKIVCNANVKHYVLNTNSELIFATCHECMFDAIHDLCVSDYLDDVNARVKSKSVKSRSAKSKKKCGNLLGLRHNLFYVGQFCDSDLEVAFRKHTCYVRNLEGANLLSESRDTNLYTISLDDIPKSSPICLLSKASKTKSWLWHGRLSHLNFGTLNQLAKHGLVRGLPKLKFKKDHLCSANACGEYKSEEIYLGYHR
ncbi:retrovirus-related pol polyprotein from transposon TNT 1-94 [Tanacetum coccineum]